MGGLQFASALPPCSVRVTQAVILVTRYEYKNLFHQMTDFLNAYMVAQLAGVDLKDAQVCVVSAFAAHLSR
jgi:hypothetical protein